MEHVIRPNFTGLTLDVFFHAACMQVIHCIRLKKVTKATIKGGSRVALKTENGVASEECHPCFGILVVNVFWIFFSRELHTVVTVRTSSTMHKVKLVRI